MIWTKTLVLFVSLILSTGEQAQVQAHPPSFLQKNVVGPGRYVGVVKASWSSDGRNMTLLEPFSYIDPMSNEWVAPKGTVTDGASIPRIAWTIIGGPFEGIYRDAAVIHDAACQERSRSWELLTKCFMRRC